MCCDGDSGLVLVRSNTPRGFILTNNKASKVIRFAAYELQRYIKVMADAHIPVREDRKVGRNSLIILGDEGGEELPGLGLPEDEHDSFMMRVTDGFLILAGSNDRSLLYAVYQLLEELGCRWLAPGEDYIPRRRNIIIPWMDVRRRAAVKWRILAPGAGMEGEISREFVDWTAKQKFNVIRSWEWYRIARSEVSAKSEPIEEIRRRGLKIMGGGHIPQVFLPIEKYYRDHPEWFSLIDGRRTRPGDRWKICHSNREAEEKFIENMVEALRRAPVDIMAVWENDGYGGWCECEDCRALEPDPDRLDPITGYPIRTTTYMRFIKKVVSEVRRVLPQIMISFGPYYELTVLPEDRSVLPPRSNTLLQIDYYEQCFRHSIADPCNRGQHERLIRDWARLYPVDNFVWLYYHDNVKICSVPFGLISRIAKDIRYIVDRGVNGFLDLICGTTLEDLWSREAVNLYLLAKLSWNPKQDEWSIVEDFLKHYYGRAWHTMLTFHKLLDQATYRIEENDIEWDIKEDIIHKPEITSPKQVIPNHKTLNELLNHLKTAEEEAEQEIHKRRVQLMRRNMEFLKELLETEDLPKKEKAEKISEIRRKYPEKFIERVHPGLLEIIKQWTKRGS